MQCAITSIAIISPYHGGSHAEFIHNLQTHVLLPSNTNNDLFTLPPKKWGWKLRTAALTFAQTLPCGDRYACVLVTSMLNLSELLSLRPDWAAIPRKIIYMHENQLVYPKRNEDQVERDYYFGHAQIVSCLVADMVVWNSKFNLDSFVGELVHFLKTIPASRPRADVIGNSIRAKSIVLHFPISFTTITNLASSSSPLPTFPTNPIHIAFPHRWEHDKGVNEFLSILRQLMDERVEFRISIFGGEEFQGCTAREQIQEIIGPERLVHVGRVPSRALYLARLAAADVAISTSQHEFFGCAMVEAAILGCACLAPNRLVYPEIFMPDSLYNTERQVVKTLVQWCRNPSIVRHLKTHRQANLNSQLVPGFENLVNLDCDCVVQRFKDLLLLPCGRATTSTSNHRHRVVGVIVVVVTMATIMGRKMIM